MPQYLVVRTDKQQKPFILRELEAGRLRQGWGYDAAQDLRQLIVKWRDGKRLNSDEKDALRNRRLLDTEPDGVKPGDVLLLPNLPEDGLWVLARVAGPYSFEISNTSSRAGPDYGHIVPVHAVRDSKGHIAVVDPDNEHVDARLRATMRNLGRMWSVDALGPRIEELLRAIEAGADIRLPEPATKKAQAVFDALRDAAWKSISEKYKGAELERLVHELLRRVYSSGTVEHHGGRGEHGADLIVYTTDPLGLEYKVAVQVKMHDGVHAETRALEQIKEAREHHRIHSGVVVTTAVQASAGFEQRAEQLAEELGIDIRVIARDEFVTLALAHLGAASL